MLSEINQTEKDKCYIISVICGILKKERKEKAQLIDIENKWVVTRIWGVGGCAKWVKEVKRSKFPVISKSRRYNVQHGSHT